MCKSLFHPFLAAIPKCEHHMHLEGALGPPLLFTLAARNSITLPSPSADPSFASPAALLDRYTRFTSLDDFLHYYYVGMSVLLHVADFEDLAWDYFQYAHSDGVVHAEVFFDPQAHTTRGVSYEVVIEGFEKACKRAEVELGISTKLILCFVRHLPVREAEDMLETAKVDLVSGRLTGVGLDSSEKGFPPAMFRNLYEMAATTGTRRTAHAGEEGDAASIRAALKELGIERIDHGIQMMGDEALMEEVAQRRLLVTVCPLSNVRLRCVDTLKEVPIRKFLDKGVKFSINSDDPAYFGGYILDNYCAVQEAFGLSVKEWERIARAAIGGSWCDDKRKQEMVEKLEQVIGKHTYLA